MLWLDTLFGAFIFKSKSEKHDTYLVPIITFDSTKVSEQ